MKICIIVPTYNEKDNIAKLLSQIFDLSIDGLGVLVVDDSSPDGTAKMVESLKSNYPALDLLIRQKKDGLGQAYIAGFRRALAGDAEYIFEMDADLSHDPEYLPKFLEAIKENDLVLGSRYVSGGGVANWNIFRRLISRFGNIYARAILGVPYHDLTGGYKCYKRRVLENLDFDQLGSLGYNFQIETTYKAHLSGFKIKEIPIIFTERVEGKSKFNFKIMVEGFWRVLLLRFKTKKRK